jgi:hypothetical protein
MMGWASQRQGIGEKGPGQSGVSSKVQVEGRAGQKERKEPFSGPTSRHHVLGKTLSWFPNVAIEKLPSSDPI